MSMESMNPAEQPAKDMNIFSRIWNVFVAPASTFEAVKTSPKWVIPFLISAIISSIGTFVLIPVIMEENRDKIVEQFDNRNVPDEQRATAMKVQKYIILVSGVVAGVALPFLLAAFWLFVVNVLSGGSAKYVQVLGAFIYTGFISVLGFLIKLPIIFSQRTVNVHFSPATFMGDAAKETFLYRLFAKFDLFSIWGMIVLAIGISIVAGLKPKKVMPWVVIIYLLWWVGTAALGNLASA